MGARRRRKPLDDDEIVRALAEYYGFSPEGAAAARDTLRLRPDDFRVRFTELLCFARDFSLPIERLAAFIAANTSGIKPWVPPVGPVKSAWSALIAGEFAAAETHANELLERVPSSSEQWDVGNWIHHAHLILGHVRLRNAEVSAAEGHLLAAGRTPGSPQLNSFGPNMTVAKTLLERGRREAVVDYLRECATFWECGLDRLAKWQDAGGGRRHSRLRP